MLARLVKLAPQLVLPKMDAVLVRLLRRLEEPPFAANARLSHKDELAETLQLLYAMVRGSGDALEGCVCAILPLALAQLASAPTEGAVAQAACALVGELAVVRSSVVAPHARGVVPRLVDVLCAQPVGRARAMAATALTQFVSVTGRVVAPYRYKAHGLVQTLLEMLQSGRSRQDVAALKCLEPRPRLAILRWFFFIYF